MTENSAFPPQSPNSATAFNGEVIGQNPELNQSTTQPVQSSAPQYVPPTSNPVPEQPTQNQAASDKTPTSHTIVTILALFFLPIIGLILMWVWTNWSKGVKIALTVLFLVIPVVLGILAIMAAAVLVAVNPAQQIGKARDAKRQNDVAAIVYAVNEYKAMNNNVGPMGITSTAKVISNKPGDTGIDLCTILVPEFLSALPVDPTSGTNGSVEGESVTSQDCTKPYSTGYSIVLDTNQQYTVAAIGEQNPSILATE